MTNRERDAEIERWIHEYTPRLLPVAASFVVEADDAEDLLQELWITAYERAPLRAPDAPVMAWLYTILLNIGRTRWRRRRRRERLMSLWGREVSLDHSLDNHSEVGANSALWRSVAELPRLQREALLLRIVEDLSIAQVAERLGRAEGTIKASLHRALNTLRSQWKK